MTVDESALREWSEATANRVELWTRFVAASGVASLAEIGVYRGQFAQKLLAGAPEHRALLPDRSLASSG